VSEQLIDLLKLCLLALLYLFFLRVIWAVWSELRTPAVANAARGGAPRRARPAAAPGPVARTTPQRLATLRVIDPPESAGREYPVTAEMTIGRAPGCAIVVDDTFVSQIHARVYSQPDGLHVEDLGSTNGTFHNGEPVSGPVPLTPGDRIAVGGTTLELL
jgi:pSer/pThr/pTyr-binding forkhead associated (FHA) protein